MNLKTIFGNAYKKIVDVQKTENYSSPAIAFISVS